MTTLIEFKAKVQETRAKLQNPANTLQKQQTLLQYLKDFCAHTLEQRDLTPEFEQTVMTEVLAIEKELKQVKKQNLAMAANPTFATSGSMAEIPVVTDDKQQFQRGGDLPPSNYAPVTDSSNMWQTVPISAFDPSASPILRRLMNKELIHGSMLSGGATSYGKSNKPEPKEEIAPESSSSPLMQDVDKHMQELATVEKSASPSPVMENISPFPQTSPFPQPASSFPKPLLKTAQLDIPQFKIRFEIPAESSFRLGREDLDAKLKSFSLGDDFLSPILPKLPEGSKGPSEHFVIDQPTPGEFLLRDRTNQQKTYFNGIFVTEKGAQLKSGDSFIIPVLIKNQLSSLTMIFTVNP